MHDVITEFYESSQFPAINLFVAISLSISATYLGILPYVNPAMFK
jgi:hypothetical protein